MKTQKMIELLATEEGLIFARSLQSLGLFGGQSMQNQNAVSLSGRYQPILDWYPVETDSGVVFTRTDTFPCKPKNIEMKHPNKLRVCLFGESMAAGFPLAPAYTPALVLQEILNKFFKGQQVVEVIDLAMPNMGPSEQLKVCEATMQLEPDVCVFMTGNNWYYGLSVEPTASPVARCGYANYLEEGGFEQLTAQFRHQLSERAVIITKEFLRLAHTVNAHALMVIPPINHAWERRNPLPYSEHGAASSWHNYFEEAKCSLMSKDFHVALAAAENMKQWDNGLTGVPERMMVRALIGLGRRQEAREAAIRAIDAVNWQNYSWALPQTPSYVARAIHEIAEQAQASCINLDALFVEYTGDPFIDFRMLYDHCHLSVEGIQVAMSAVAEKIIKASVGAEPNSNELLKNTIKPEPLIEASAHFQAAHWRSQFFTALPSDALGANLQNELMLTTQLDNNFIDIVKDHLRIKSLYCSPLLNHASRQAMKVPGMAASLLLKRLNPIFLAALLETIKALDQKEYQEILSHISNSFHDQFVMGLDISKPMFQNCFWERTPTAIHDPNDRHSSPYFRAYWATSEFSFLSHGNIPLTLEVVARSAKLSEKLEVIVNEKSLGNFKLTKKWQKIDLLVPASQVQQGINSVNLQWKTKSFDETNELKQTIHNFQLGVETEIFPLFGEIYSLIICSNTLPGK